VFAGLFRHVSHQTGRLEIRARIPMEHLLTSDGRCVP
jgi:hypothetical protein